MRKDSEKLPEQLRPYGSHGVELSPGPGNADDWHGDCPFCEKRGKFYVDAETGKHDCKVCGASGNAITFLTRIAKAAADGTTRTRYAELVKSRGIPAGLFRDAGIGYRNGEWLVPCVSETNTVRDLRRYDGKKTLSTAGCKSQLWGADRLAAAGEGARVLLAEGEWDGLAGRWMLRDAGEDGVVVAVPGATVFKPEWAKLFAGKRVVTVYDNDDAGDRGQIKAEQALRGVALELSHVCWPEDHKEGYDLRDFARERIPANGAAAALEELLSLTKEAPRREVGDGTGGHPGDKASSKLRDQDVEDRTLEEVHAAFAARLDMNPEFSSAVEVILAIHMSNDVKDDPLWVYLMGPAGTGKTELLTAVMGSQRSVFRSTVTPKCLVSGFKGDGAKDPSLIPKLKGRTLVAKDFTEVLSLPEVQQNEIYSTLRGAYDGFVDKTFGNGAERHYHDCQFSIVAGVTTAILKHRQSAMGERFLKYRLTRLSAENARARARKSLENLGRKRRRGEELQRVVAGYLKQKLPDELPGFSDDAADAIIDMAEIVSRMRVQVERDQRHDTPQYKPEQEGLDRVTKQLGTLARILAWMHGEDEVGETELAVVRKVAFDTVCGFDSDIVDAMMRMGGRADKKDIAEACGLSRSTAERRIDDLLMVGVLERSGDTGTSKAGGRPATVYAVRDELASLWSKTKNGDQEWTGSKNKSRQVKRSGTRRLVAASSRSSASTSGTAARSRPRLVRASSGR